MDRTIDLTPAQKAPSAELQSALASSPVHVLRCNAGMGRTTILRNVQEAIGGIFIGVKNFLDRLKTEQPIAIEETFISLIEDSFEKNNLVIVDDLHLLWNVVDGYNYSRSWLLDVALTALLDEAGCSSNRIVFGVDDGSVPKPVARRARFWQVDEFSPRDYEWICRAYAVDSASNELDFDRIHRFAPVLNVWQLKNTFASFASKASMDTDRLIATSAGTTS